MQKGVRKIESEVFHFPPVPHDPSGLSDFVKPHAAVDHPSGGPSLTRQDMAEDCDINNIMARNPNVGIMPFVGEALYYDFTELPATMQDAMETMLLAREAFMTLPADVRREFDNDPARFVDFASNPDAMWDGGRKANAPQSHLDWMREWELAPPKKAPAAAVVAASADLVSPVAPVVSQPGPAVAPAPAK